MDAQDAPTVERDGIAFAHRARGELDWIYDDVFVAREYDFASTRTAPMVIDAGAHVGVATLFFKWRYPAARVVAVEPNPDTFALLERNIRQNGLSEVEAVNAAVAPAPGEIPFYATSDPAANWSWGDAALPQLWHDPERTRQLVVPAVTLSSLLTGPTDLLKLDIEGFETVALVEAADRLHLVDRLAIEFHGSPLNPDNDLWAALALLRGAGFACVVQDMHQNRRVISETWLDPARPFLLMIHARHPGRLRRLDRQRRRVRRAGR